MKLDRHDTDVDLPFSDGVLTGFSRSGLATYCEHKPSGLVFDLGHCPLSMVGTETVFLTHTHLDHSAGVLRLLQLRALQNLPPPVIYAPARSVNALNALTVAMAALDHSGPVSVSIHPVDVDTVQMFWRSSSVLDTVSAFAVDHVVDSVGYRVERSVRRLKSEHVGKPVAEIKRLREAGEATEFVTTDRFVFIGDSTVQPFRDNPAILDCDTLVMEATYLEQHPNAAKYGHACLPELADVLRERMRDGSCPAVYLKHFSLRYDAAEIHAAVDALAAEGLPVVAMVPR